MASDAEKEPLDLSAIEGRLKEATPGPWLWENHMGVEYLCGNDEDNDVIMGDDYERSDTPNGILIAHAPTDIAALVAEVKRLREEGARFDRVADYFISLGYELPD